MKSVSISPRAEEKSGWFVILLWIHTKLFISHKLDRVMGYLVILVTISVLHSPLPSSVFLSNILSYLVKQAQGLSLSQNFDSTVLFHLGPIQTCCLLMFFCGVVHLITDDAVDLL